MSGEYHGVLLDAAFEDQNFINCFKVFWKRKSTRNSWTIFGVIVPEAEIGGVIKKIQKNLLQNKPYYAHFYRKDDMIVVFREKVFRIKPDKSTWAEAVKYGMNKSIPQEQMDFFPARFEDEKL
jgi:hypothetical protein